MNALESRIGGAVLLWAVAFAAVAAVIGWETDWGRGWRRAPPAAPPPAAAPVNMALLPDYALEGGTAARRETVDRPAFVPTRRPAPAPVQEAARPRMQRGQFALTGTAVVDKGSIAFLRETSGGKSRSVRVGDTINGLTVAEVGRDRVKLVLGDEAEELQLKVAAGPRATIQPPPPGQPGQPQQPGMPGQPVAGAQPGAPVAPQPAIAQAAPGQPSPLAGLQPTQAPAGATDAEASLLERRRAARAAQAAAEAAARGNTPAPAAPAAPGATPVPPDPGWAILYRRLQQPLK